MPPPHTKDGNKYFTSAWLSRPVNYFRALVLSEWIFKKIGDIPNILHSMNNFYYKQLIMSDNLTTFARHAAEIPLMNENELKALLAAGPGPAIVAHEDGSDVGSDIDEDGPAEPLPPAPPAPPPPPAPFVPHVLEVAVDKLPAIEFNHPGLPRLHVNFDIFSNETGNRRAFLYCAEHTNCRLYVFIRDYASVQHAASFWFAWGLGASSHPSRTMAAEHVADKPSDVYVDVCHRMQFG